MVLRGAPCPLSDRSQCVVRAVDAPFLPETGDGRQDRSTTIPRSTTPRWRVAPAFRAPQLPEDGHTRWRMDEEDYRLAVDVWGKRPIIGVGNRSPGSVETGHGRSSHGKESGGAQPLSDGMSDSMLFVVFDLGRQGWWSQYPGSLSACSTNRVVWAELVVRRT